MTIVEKWRRYKGWTYAEFGERAGLTGSTIGSHCTVEKTLQYKTATRLARAIGVTYEEFIAGPPATRRAEERADERREPNKPLGNEEGLADMRGVAEEDILRAMIGKISGNMTKEQLVRLLGYAEGLADSGEVKKNISNAS